jgi:hypothetical protein
VTGPGLRLFWPLSDRELRLPYPLYGVVVVGLGLVVTIRLGNESGDGTATRRTNVQQSSRP